MKAWGPLLVGAFLLVAPRAGAEPDAERSAWRYRRPVTAEGVGGLAVLPLPLEVVGRCQSGLADLRLLRPDGQEVPYVLDRAVVRESALSWSGRLVDTRREVFGPPADEQGETSLVADLGEERTFDTLELEIPGRDFAKRIRVEGSADRVSWILLRDDAGVFDGLWGGRIHHTTIALLAPARARFLRLSIGDRRGSPPVRVSGVTALARRRIEAEQWHRSVALSALRAGRPSLYRLETPLRLPLEALELETDDPAFSRQVRLLEVGERDGGRVETVLGEATLYRLRIAGRGLAGEERVLRLRQAPQGGELLLEVEDRDSPPLHDLRAVATGPEVRLVFPAPPGPLVLYYGNEATRGPLYDLEALKGEIALARGRASATLGVEAENPLYRKPEPIPFASLWGGRVETWRWRAFRRVQITGQADIFALALAAPDVGATRPDFGDLRIVGDGDRQVPYLLEQGPLEGVGLEVETLPAKPGEGGPLSLYRLRVPAASAGGREALSLVSLELGIAEPFFERGARLLAPTQAGGAGERPLFAGPLSRRPSSERRTGAAPSPVVVRLAGTPVAELTLEVADGDNARLTLLGATGRVRVPRLVFKAGPGAYRLLLGNPEATPPRYDLASLRQEVLAYSARTVGAGPPEPNPAFRRSAADYFRDAPPTVVLWGALLGAVVALLLLTARVLRQPPPSP